MTTNDPIAKPTPVPPDDLRRALTVATPDDLALTHLSVGASTYTILLSGDDTGGRFTLIDMYVPPGGGPPPHRHDFEETFIVTEGQLDVSFRGVGRTVTAGTTVNVPANAPHHFRNSSGQPAPAVRLRAARPGRVLRRRRGPRPRPDLTAMALS
jgi:quercetin dioxygenase-like cupin family protein